MRPKIVVAILILASGILAVMLLVSHAARHVANDKSAAIASVVQQEANVRPAKQSPISAPVVVTEHAERPSPPVINPAVEETNPEVYSQQRVAELMELARNDDSNSLHTICSELTNPDKEIRAGALAAAVQFGDRSVIPYLRELAAQTSDPFERADITKAADQLALPLLGEVDQSQPGTGQQNGQ